MGNTARFSRPTATRRIARRRSARITQSSRRPSTRTPRFTTASLQRDWFFAQARGYGPRSRRRSTATTFPPAVVENLIATTRQASSRCGDIIACGSGRSASTTYHSYDTAIPLIEFDRKYPYEDVLEWLPASVAPLGEDYQQAHAGNSRGAVDRRVRESRQAQRRVLGAGVRRSARTCC